MNPIRPDAPGIHIVDGETITQISRLFKTLNKATRGLNFCKQSCIDDPEKFTEQGGQFALCTMIEQQEAAINSLTGLLFKAGCEI